MISYTGFRIEDLGKESLRVVMITYCYDCDRLASTRVMYFLPDVVHGTGCTYIVSEENGTRMRGTTFKPLSFHDQENVIEQFG